MREYKVFITSKNNGDRLTPYELKDITLGGIETSNEITINTSERYQKILGFGGALTEASAYTLSKLDKDVRKDILNKYYDENSGLGYTFARVHINSCDFSLNNYSYVEDGDIKLETFSLDRDERYVLPLVRDVKEITKNNLSILASPWSPPKFMKTNGEMNNGGKLKEEYGQLWADYFVKYIEKMKEKGIDIWAVTIQNEPAAKQVWDSCLYSAEEERDFVKNHLGPTLHKNGLEDIKVIIWDHNRDIVYDRAKVVLEDEEAAKYVWGTGIHWYVSEEFSNTSKVHDEFPDKHIIFTEGCQEGGVKLGSWNTGERYGRNIIGDLNNYIEAWIDWNIVLDETGGPNHVNNLCDAPVIVDTVNKEVYYNSSFYYIAHFSKFIKKNAVRVKTTVIGNKIHGLCCVNEDNSVSLVIMNENNEDKNIRLNIDDESSIITIKANSIYTLIK